MQVEYASCCTEPQAGACGMLGNKHCTVQSSPQGYSLPCDTVPPPPGLGPTHRFLNAYSTFTPPTPPPWVATPTDQPNPLQFHFSTHSPRLAPLPPLAPLAPLPLPPPPPASPVLVPCAVAPCPRCAPVPSPAPSAPSGPQVSCAGRPAHATRHAARCPDSTQNPPRPLANLGYSVCVVVRRSDRECACE